MKKRLLKAMPHVPILKLKPELQEENETQEDPDDPQDAADDTEVNTEGTDKQSAAEMEANTTFHDLEAEQIGRNNGLIQRVKRFVSKRNGNGGNIAAGRTGLMMGEDDTMHYGDEESSESDNDADQQDGIPLVRRSKRT